MSVIDEIKKEVAQIGNERGLEDYQAFAYWFLETFQDHSQEESQDIVTDGPWDGGCDAIYLDDEEKIIYLYQFKYSEDITYAEKGLTDIQDAIKNNIIKIQDYRSIHFYLVTLAKFPDAIRKAPQTNVKKAVGRILKSHSLGSISFDLEIVDLDEFRRLYEKIIGINIELSYQLPPINVGNSSLVGLLDPNPLRNHVSNDDLLAYNIRKFLGRKGSVNHKIRETLEDDEKRPKFWKMNNGIVCLCTKFEKLSKEKYYFENFTIVNGAQTVNTIAQFLQKYPGLENDPIWVMSKILLVEDNDIDTAIELTKSSNSQNSTSTKDLRASDSLHKSIKEWMLKEYNVNYIYKRGEKNKKGMTNIHMKDIAQAHVAYWISDHVCYTPDEYRPSARGLLEGATKYFIQQGRSNFSK